MENICIYHQKKNRRESPDWQVISRKPWETGGGIPPSHPAEPPGPRIRDWHQKVGVRRTPELGETSGKSAWCPSCKTDSSDTYLLVFTWSPVTLNREWLFGGQQSTAEVPRDDVWGSVFRGFAHPRFVLRTARSGEAMPWGCSSSSVVRPRGETSSSTNSPA